MKAFSSLPLNSFRMDNSRLSSVLACMEHNALSPAGFIQQLINSGEAAHETACKSLFHHTPSLCEALYKHSETKQSIIGWALGIAKCTLCKEVEELTHEKHGLHFKAKSATAEQQEGFILNEIAKTMQEGGPHLWMLVTALLDHLFLTTVECGRHPYLILVYLLGKKWTLGSLEESRLAMKETKMQSMMVIVNVWDKGSVHAKQHHATQHSLSL